MWPVPHTHKHTHTHTHTLPRSFCLGQPYPQRTHTHTRTQPRLRGGVYVCSLNFDAAKAAGRRVCVCVRVWACVCVCGYGCRSQKLRESVCVCVCVCMSLCVCAGLVISPTRKLASKIYRQALPVCDVTHLSVWRDSFECVTRLMHIPPKKNRYWWFRRRANLRRRFTKRLFNCVNSTIWPCR